MMKWRVARRNSCEDSEVKSSLDLLDSILAEYENNDNEELVAPLNSWLTSAENKNDSFAYCRQSKNHDGIITYRHSLPSDVSRLRKIPPIPPTRSPSTRLSCSDPYGYKSLPHPIPIYVGHQTNKRSASLPERPAMTTFGHVTHEKSPILPDYPNDIPVFETNSKSLLNDFRQSLHFDVFGDQAVTQADIQIKNDSNRLQVKKDENRNGKNLIRFNV